MRILVTSVICAILILGFPTLAEKLQLFDSDPVSSAPVTQAQAVNDTRLAAAGQIPTRGMTMKQVESQFGQPGDRRAPVGDPPITRWEYQGFIVYFEYRHVIHAVEKQPR